jgi:hypothetical protein
MPTTSNKSCEQNAGVFDLAVEVGRIADPVHGSEGLPDVD